MKPSLTPALLAVAFAPWWSACRSAPAPSQETHGAPPVKESSSDAAPPQHTAAPYDNAAASSTEDPGHAGAAEDACPKNMIFVHGNYCPVVEQRCLNHSDEYARDQEQREKLAKKGESLPPSRISERCLQYEKPSKCLTKTRQAMRFCIDRYEWPNEAGKVPDLAVTWLRAKEQCEAAGKRLCEVEEFDFACEGEEMRPYAYGFDRDTRRCNIDKPYVRPLETATPYEDCLKLPHCKARLAELDQRVPSGSMPDCASPFGVMDLNGNVNEWVNRAGQGSPWRSGLKGGWWGPARSRCRPTVTAHNEIYAGYEVGFRCCRDARPTGRN